MPPINIAGVGELVARQADVPNVHITDFDRVEGLRYLSRLVRGGRQRCKVQLH